MTNDELNHFILHYLTEDKTKSAIMLTGDWGIGKSYYISHILKPFLERGENGKHQCIIVSLYGIKDTVEISKAIYFEARAKFLQARTEAGTAVKITTRTIIKGVTSFFGVDLSSSSENMKELYESADLSGMLIVLEDLERSGLDILEVLGYVNNLVEQDGVKVLLVANEQEMIKTEQKAVKGTARKEKVITVNTENTDQYLRKKEKTVSDTIIFQKDIIFAIQQIISSFENDTLNRFATAESAKDIVNIMSFCHSFNLRSFIFACQKAVDIFNSLDSKFTSDDDFIQAIFFGILFYVLRVKKGKELQWRFEKLYSIELGHERFPLFKFCYDYLTRQIIDTSNVQDAFDAFTDLRLFDKNKSNSDPDITTISNYHIHSEEEVLTALKNIENRLENKPDDISFYMYGTIAVYSIVIKAILGCDITKIKNLLVSNLNGKGTQLQFESIFRTSLGDDERDDVKKEFKTLCQEMAESLRVSQIIFPGFDYRPEQADALYNNILEKNIRFNSEEGFVCNLDMKKMAEMFRLCSPKQKDNIRGAFLTVYRSISYSSPSEYESIIKLLEIIKAQRENDVGDKIQQLQYDYFIRNLTEIAEKLQ